VVPVPAGLEAAMRLFRLCRFWFYCLPLFFSLPLAHAQTVPLPAMHTGQVSVSGLSSGGYMAVQFEVAFSSTVTGAGIVAGGPYYCARGSVYIATTSCSCTSTLFNCRVRAGGTAVPQLIAVTDVLAADGFIDPTAGLQQHRIWMLSGSEDTLVPHAVMDDLKTYYRHYVDANHISYKRDLPAEHAMPTDSYGNRCDKLASPYISNCAYDAAGALLQWIYGPLNPRGAAGGRFIRFDQGEFLPDPAFHGMSDSGYLYVPPGCDNGASDGCKLHVIFHGCLQDSGSIGQTFIHHAGYNAWADSNRIVLLYPQTAPLYPFSNPQACWDWFSYDDPRYAQRAGHQMAAVKRMIDRLTGKR
jgi:poly(3-hydroxybutyrate) depolymerase